MAQDIPAGQVLTAAEARNLSLEHDMVLCRYFAIALLDFFDEDVDALPGGDHRTAIQNMRAILGGAHEPCHDQWRAVVRTFLDKAIARARKADEEPWSNNEPTKGEEWVEYDPIVVKPEDLRETVQRWMDAAAGVMADYEVRVGDPVVPPGAPFTASTVEVEVPRTESKHTGELGCTCNRCSEFNSQLAELGSNHPGGEFKNPDDE